MLSQIISTIETYVPSMDVCVVGLRRNLMEVEYCPQCGVRAESSQHHCHPTAGSLDFPEAKTLQRLVKGKAQIGYENSKFFFYYPGYYSVHEDDGTINSNREVWNSTLKRYIGSTREEALKFIREYNL